MKIMNRLLGPPTSPYRYTPGPNSLGVGANNMALARPGGTPYADWFRGAGQVLRGFKVTQPPQVWQNQDLKPTDLRGGGTPFAITPRQGLYDFREQRVRGGQ